jgi:hypothetical protein
MTYPFNFKFYISNFKLKNLKSAIYNLKSEEVPSHTHIKEKADPNQG